MDATDVLRASVLDIVFEGRNKEYGAYILRKDYNRRLNTAMISTFILCAALCLLFYFRKDTHQMATIITLLPDSGHILQPVTDIMKQPAQAHPPAPRKRTVRFAGPPQIVRDVLKTDQIPENSSIDRTAIGTMAQDGIDDANASPPVEKPSNGSAYDRPVINPDSVVRDAQIQSSYPGGMAAWKRFLIKTFSYPQTAQENNIQGAVVVQFIVDKEGNVSEVQAISGPAELRGEAARVIKKSGRWNPAKQNGIEVKSYKMQSIVFRLEE